MPENLKPWIDPDKLGYLDLETTFNRARYLYQKTYMYQYKDKDGNTQIDVKGAGMTDDVKENITFENFHGGLKVEGLKKGKTVEGGVMITDSIFTLKNPTFGV